MSHIYGTRLFDDPIVIYCKRWSLFDVESGFKYEPINPIVSFLACHEVVWLIPSPWLAEDKWAAEIYRRTQSSIKSKAPRHRVIFVANTRAEHVHFKQLGLESFVANQNQFVDRTIFTPLRKPADRHFDAVYNARLKKYKRHELARKIARLILIGYSFDTPEHAEICNMLSSAQLANRKSDGLRLLSSNEVNEVLNIASCGLCLSSIEGAMSAAVEYLLAGIPVVTTTSRGGRDFFFDGRFTRWVAPEADEVAREVRNLAEEKISPCYIRSETIRKIDIANEEFLYNLSSLLGVSRSSLASEFYRRFNHRLATPKPISAFLEKNPVMSQGVV